MALRFALLLSIALSLVACAPAGTGGGGDPGDGSGVGGKADGTEDGPALRYAKYEVLFTNPLCGPYAYGQPVPTADGSGEVTGKPANVYCIASRDAAPSGMRPNTPQQRILDWLAPLGEGDEVFLAFLTFSNRPVSDALCAAVARGAKVTMILGHVEGQGEKLQQCGGTVLARGNVGGIGWAHNKIILINPEAPGASDADEEHVRIAFGSGNLSSGVVLHHENWHFIEAARDSYFAQAHRCLARAQVDEQASSARAAYREYMNACRDEIEAQPEGDIRAYFIPVSEDSSAITRRMVNGVRSARSIDVAAHRFGFTTLVNELEDRLYEDELFSVRMVADDDLYWLRPYGGGDGTTVGVNQQFEASNVVRLFEAGGGGERFEIRYMETNHGERLLHHNKFLVFRDEDGVAHSVLYGAANLTGAGFKDNFENIYWTTIPEVVAAFDAQMARFWDGQRASEDEPEPPVATPPERMPATNVAPTP